MSHFTVLVIGDNIEEQLAPFQENNMGDCPKEYLEFNDYTEEVIKSWDSLVKDDPEVYEKYKNKSIEDFAKEYHGYGRDENGERFGFYENPNAKWDWYEIGGRWTGFFKLKEGKSGLSGNPGLMTKRNINPSYADQALKGDIDFEAMRNEAGNKAAERWDSAHSLMGDFYKTFESWTVIRERYKSDIGLARNIYHEQEAIKALNADSEKRFLWNVDDVMCSKEECVKAARDRAMTTFAIIKDSKWFEKGDMGWWGVVSNETEQSEWNCKFFELLDSLHDNTLLTVVDCHI